MCFLSLKNIRKQSHFTQKELAELSWVTLRMIQAYEQGDQDIMKAEARTVFALAKVLGYAAEVICGKIRELMMQRSLISFRRYFCEYERAPLPTGIQRYLQ